MIKYFDREFSKSLSESDELCYVVELNTDKTKLGEINKRLKLQLINII